VWWVCVIELFPLFVYLCLSLWVGVQVCFFLVTVDVLYCIVISINSHICVEVFAFALMPSQVGFDTVAQVLQVLFGPSDIFWSPISKEGPQ
jgi:hypothetical protein